MCLWNPEVVMTFACHIKIIFWGWTTCGTTEVKVVVILNRQLVISSRADKGDSIRDTEDDFCNSR